MTDLVSALGVGATAYVFHAGGHLPPSGTRAVARVVQTTDPMGEASASRGEIVLRDGARLRVRAIRPDDREALARGFEQLSHHSRENRFLTRKDRLTSRELTLLTDVDHHTHEALVAIDTVSGQGVAVARYAAWPDDARRVELAVTVDDAWQRRGVGAALVRCLLVRAREEGIELLEATTRSENAAANALLRRLGFTRRQTAWGLAEFQLVLAAHAGRNGRAA